MPDEALEAQATKALVDYGGCSEERAASLVDGWKEVLILEGLSVVAGTERVTTSVSDLRVERVRRLVEELKSASPPNPYELGVLMRLPITQARTVLRNWRARYPADYDGHMHGLAASGEYDTGGAGETLFITYRAFEVLEYAVERLRSRGLQQGLRVDRSLLRIEIPEATTTVDGKDALEVLGIPR